MPARLLRDGILDSAAVNSLSFPAEVFYRRLMSVVDDFGRFDGRAAVLRGRLYSLKLDTVREADITRWIAECEKAGLIALYAVEGKPYLLFHRLGTPRAKESKYPPPPADVGTRREHPFSDVNRCAQTHADAPYSGSGADTGTDANPTGGATAEPPPAEPPPVVPREQKSPSGPHPEACRMFMARWAEAYPASDPYPFEAKDGAAVSAILKAVGADLDKFRAILGRYFANGDRFFAGHPLPKLRGSLSQFMVDAPAASHRRGFQTRTDEIYDHLGIE